jgi:hypothetical protein
VVGTEVSEEHAASILKAEVYTFRNRLEYLGKTKKDGWISEIAP